MDHEYGYNKLLHNAATTGNGEVVDLSNVAGDIAVYITWSSGCTAGAFTMETASSSSTYSGTWASLGIVSLSTADKCDVFHFTGPLRFFRARISTTVAGGTATVRLLSR